MLLRMSGSLHPIRAAIPRLNAVMQDALEPPISPDPPLILHTTLLVTWVREMSTGELCGASLLNVSL